MCFSQNAPDLVCTAAFEVAVLCHFDVLSTAPTDSTSMSCSNAAHVIQCEEAPPQNVDAAGCDKSHSLPPLNFKRNTVWVELCTSIGASMHILHGLTQAMSL